VLRILLPFTFAVLWAASYTAAKIGLADITPYAFVALRLTVAAFAAMILLAARRVLSPPRSLWPHLMIGGALVHGVALSTAHAALVTVGATPTALVHAFHPVLTAALGVLLLGETFRWWQWAGAALGLAGVLLGVPFGAGENVLVLLAASLIGLSGGTLYIRRFCVGVPPFEATAIQLVGGALFAIAAMLLLETPHVHFTWSLAAAMAWNILLMSIVGMVLYTFILTRYGAGRAASAFFVVPGAAALIAWLLLGEHLSWLTVFGLFAATCGVALVWWRPRKRALRFD
jgi:drug/metabolite transporter (DMT)-like permease